MNIDFLKFCIKLQSFFIFNSLKRKQYRKIKLKHFYKKLYYQSKWGVSYSVFDGEELLEASLKQIRSAVDYINVVYQEYSWYGNPASENLKNILINLKKKGLIDELIKYNPNYSLPAHIQEKEKRNIGLQYAKKQRCNYFMTMDCDEFYTNNELAKAKKYIIQNDITNSYCLQYKYLTDPTIRNVNFVGYVGFFFYINKTSCIGEDDKKPVIIDSTRIVNTKVKKKYFVLKDLRMHHMEFVRKDLTKKIKNSSLGKPINIPKENNAYNIIKVPNVFNINIEKEHIC